MCSAAGSGKPTRGEFDLTLLAPSETISQGIYVVGRSLWECKVGGGKKNDLKNRQFVVCHTSANPGGHIPNPEFLSEERE